MDDDQRADGPGLEGAVTHADGEGREQHGQAAGRVEGDGIAEPCGSDGRLADADGRFSSDGDLQRGRQHGLGPQDGGAGERLADAEHAERRAECEIDRDAHGRDGPGGRSDAGRMGDADEPRSQGRRLDAGEHADQRTAWASGELVRMGDAGSNDMGRLGGSTSGAEAQSDSVGQINGIGGVVPGSAGFWSRGEFIPCADGKARRVEPGIFPLAHGVSNRVGVLRGAGNAIVPQAAAEFIRAAIEALPAA